MMKPNSLSNHLTVVAFFMAITNSWAQQDSTKLKQEVEVTKAYQPNVPDAVKINDIPAFKSERTAPPTFNYSIYSKPVFSIFDVKPVAAAKMTIESQSELARGLLKAGFGNYLTPYGELFFNSKPDEKTNFAMHFKHLSSSGQIKLLNNDKVEAPRSENQIEIFGEHFFGKSSLTGKLGFDRTAYRYYGYTGPVLSDELKEMMIPGYGQKQWLSKGTAEFGLKSGTLSSNDLDYDFGFKYHLLKTKTGQVENQGLLSADLEKKFNALFAYLTTSINFYRADSVRNHFSGDFGHRQQIVLEINPSVMWKTDQAKLEIGLNSSFVFDDDVDAEVFFYPKVKTEWEPVQQVMTLFAGIDGHLQQNTYSRIAYQNSYVDPSHDLANTNYQFVLSGGLKGKITPKTNYLAQANYSIIKDQYFFYTDGMDIYKPPTVFTRIDNTFSWLYDDVNLLKISGELTHSLNENFSFKVIGNYYSYNLKNQTEAWQMPDFDLTVSGLYTVNSRLSFTADLFFVGKRTALIRDFDSSKLISSAIYVVPNSEINMDPIIDLNAGIDYRFSDQFNFFLKLNNFGFQKYEQWLGYTNQSFNFLAGMAYSF